MKTEHVTKLSGKEYARAWLLGKATLENSATGNYPAFDDLMFVLRAEPGLAQRLVSTHVDVAHSHDVVYLEQVANGYDVYWTDHGRKVDLEHFDDLYAAAERHLSRAGIR